ncbi:MAG: DUF2946 family protein [Telluria sp.]
MSSFLRHRAGIAAVVLLALLVTVLLPVRWPAAAWPKGWTEICTVAGPKLVRLDASLPQPRAPAHAQHCTLCAAPALAWAPPPVAVAAPLPLAGFRAPSVVLAATRAPGQVWTPAQPRAPPRA